MGQFTPVPAEPLQEVAVPRALAFLTVAGKSMEISYKIWETIEQYRTKTHMLHVWNIYLHDWAIFGVNVGKYSSTMEHLGNGKNIEHSTLYGKWFFHAMLQEGKRNNN